MLWYLTIKKKLVNTFKTWRKVKFNLPPKLKRQKINVDLTEIIPDFI